MTRLVASLLLAAFLTLPTLAADQTSATDGQKTIDKALAFLKKNQQPDGSFQRSDREPPAVTALVLKALVRDPANGPKSDAAQKAIA